jgi:hypothetical protein
MVRFGFARTLACALGLLVTSASLGAHTAAAPDDAAQRAEAAADRAEKLAAAAAATLQEAKANSAEMLDRALWMENASTFVVTFFGALFTTLAIAAAFGVGLSLNELRKARAARVFILKQKKELEKHQLFLGTLANEVTRAFEEIEKRLQAELTPETGIIGVPRSSAIPQRVYDDDAMIVFADRLQLTKDQFQAARLSVLFTRVGTYWQRSSEYHRAAERMKRAVQLDEKSSAAHKGHARALWNIVADEMTAQERSKPSPAQLDALAEATRELSRARELLHEAKQVDEEIFYDEATVARFKGDYNAAEKAYLAGSKMSAAIAEVNGREPDWDFEFALACLFASLGRFENALARLDPVLDKQKSWSQTGNREELRNYREWARTDPDFKEMWADPKWKEELAKRIPPRPPV